MTTPLAKFNSWITRFKISKLLWKWNTLNWTYLKSSQSKREFSQCTTAKSETHLLCREFLRLTKDTRKLFSRWYPWRETKQGRTWRWTLMLAFSGRICLLAALFWRTSDNSSEFPLHTSTNRSCSTRSSCQWNTSTRRTESSTSRRWRSLARPSDMGSTLPTV